MFQRLPFPLNNTVNSVIVNDPRRIGAMYTSKGQEEEHDNKFQTEHPDVIVRLHCTHPQPLNSSNSAHTSEHECQPATGSRLRSRSKSFSRPAHWEYLGFRILNHVLASRSVT
jgi:hypothetical protein